MQRNSLLPNNQNLLDPIDTLMTVVSSSWSESYHVDRISKAQRYRWSSSNFAQAKPIDLREDVLPASQPFKRSGSILQGTNESDILRGLSGWDILDGMGGDDLIHGGNGRDVISGGLGADELHGDFGWNTYSDEADGSQDLIVIKSDQFLMNWWYGKSGNNPNGEKVDIIEGLDAMDKIKILGVAQQNISFADASAHGQNGIGIFANGFLEALYTGNSLNLTQIQAMTSGDNSDEAVNNSIWSFNFNNTLPPLI